MPERLSVAVPLTVMGEAVNTCPLLGWVRVRVGGVVSVRCWSRLMTTKALLAPLFKVTLRVLLACSVTATCRVAAWAVSWVGPRMTVPFNSTEPLLMR